MMNPEQDVSTCHWSDRINLREYCATCSWGTRFGCQVTGKKPTRVKLGPVIPDGQMSVRVWRFIVKRKGILPGSVA